MAEITKPIFLDETGRAMVDKLSIISSNQERQNTEIIMSSGNGALIDVHYNYLVSQASSVKEVNDLFVRWWHCCWNKAVSDSGGDAEARQTLLERWFGTVLDDERIHGVKLPLFSTSTSAIGELTDDSAGLSCTPSTATVAGRDDFAHLPQFWCLEVAMERNADGTHTINAVEFIDDTSIVRSGEHGLCQVLQKNTWVREWKDNQYYYMRMRSHASAGYHTWPQGTGKNGKTYAYMANPKYYAGIGADGIITCGTGLAPVNYTSFNGLVSLWRKRGAHYSGAAGNLLKWQLAMIRLKYARKGNSGTIEGCSSYYYRFKAVVSENGVERIILSASEAANLLVGSNVHIGSSNDGYDLAKNATITSIDTVTIDGTNYAAVSVDNGGVTFDTVSGTSVLSTMPWKSGRNDDVLGYDGSHTNYTNGKEPGLIQRTEFQNGAYLILSDELWQWSQDADGNYNFDCYTCHDQSKVTTNGSISADYTKQDDLTMEFPAGTADGWMYTEDTAISNDPGVLWLKKVSKTAGSGTGVKAGMYVEPLSSGVRAPWCVCYLFSVGNAGLAARVSHYGTTNSYWYGAGGSPSGISG
ncbi:MAG: hypothetical protein PUK18_02750 [Firmicutes bacterium]|nr:hypothetical protein [Bacillota bacterium]MDY6159361.1 hypothetical protein [Candidatus Faecousia sp.]